MAVVALKPGYAGPVQDTEDKFHGNRLLYVCWDEHLLFCAPMALPLPPAMPFGALLSDVLPGLYGSHPDFAQCTSSPDRVTILASTQYWGLRS